MEVLTRIQKSIPKEWLDNVTKKEQLAPKNAKMIRDIANGVENPDFDSSKITDKEREFARAVIDSGQINDMEKFVDVENKEYTAKIDKFIDDEIEKATKRGELPKGKKFRNINKKVKQQIKCKK